MSDGVVRPAARASEVERAADEWANEAVAERIPRLRATASEWQKSVSSMAGLLGVGALFNADTAIKGLDLSFRIGYGVSAGLALAAAGNAIWLASRAGQAGDLTIPPDITGRVAAHEKTFHDIRRRLRWSRRMTATAAVFLAVSFAVRWFGS